MIEDGLRKCLLTFAFFISLVFRLISFISEHAQKLFPSVMNARDRMCSYRKIYSVILQEVPAVFVSVEYRLAPRCRRGWP